VLLPENREALHERGIVVYLCASVEHQLERTAHDQNRPLLQTADRRGTLQNLMHIRDPLYRQTAHIIVETDRLIPKFVVQRVLRGLRMDAN
jgi:shikimate kinase